MSARPEHWHPTPIQDAVLTLICRNRPERQFVASQDPTSGAVLSGRYIAADGAVDPLTEMELQYAFGDNEDGTAEERIAELRDLHGDAVDEFEP